MTKTVKIAIGIGIVAALGTAAYLIFFRKGSDKKTGTVADATVKPMEEKPTPSVKPSEMKNVIVKPVMGQPIKVKEFKGF